MKLMGGGGGGGGREGEGRKEKSRSFGVELKIPNFPTWAEKLHAIAFITLLARSGRLTGSLFSVGLPCVKQLGILAVESFKILPR